MTVDPYEAMGEFHDLFMLEVWERLAPSLASAFGALDADAVVIDVGAGTGVGTRTLARVTAAKVIAVEPSLTMRAVLLARVADDADLAQQVSVVAGRVPEVLEEVSAPVAGFVCARMLGHLTAADRLATFGRLSELLIPGAAGVITLPRPPASDTAELVEEHARVGRHQYVARHLPSADGRTATSEYLVLDGDRVVRRQTFRSTWDPPTLDQLGDELDRVGLRLAESGAGVGLITRRPGTR